MERDNEASLGPSAITTEKKSRLPITFTSRHVIFATINFFTPCVAG